MPLEEEKRDVCWLFFFPFWFARKKVGFLRLSLFGNQLEGGHFNCLPRYHLRVEGTYVRTYYPCFCLVIHGEDLFIFFGVSTFLLSSSLVLSFFFILLPSLLCNMVPFFYPFLFRFWVSLQGWIGSGDIWLVGWLVGGSGAMDGWTGWDGMG